MFTFEAHEVLNRQATPGLDFQHGDRRVPLGREDKALGP